MKSSGIGGQAVLEGVMIKNKDHYAVAVRKPDNQIEVKTDEFHSIAKRVGLFRLPFFRGMAIFVESLILGVRTLSDSSNFCEDGEKGEPKARETMADIGVIILSLLMAVAVFILVPLLFSSLLSQLVRSETLELVLEGILRVVMFIAYVVLVSRLEDVKRIFMYHGAEHKCINCVESGQELTVANIRRQERCHRCCSTGFLLLVMLISFVLFMFIRVDTAWLRYILRIVLIPFIAGISYEFVYLAGNSNNKLIALLSKPVFCLQALTTREPDDSMIEVAIASLEAVFDWRAYQEENGIAKRRTQTKKRPEDVEDVKTESGIAAAVGNEEEEDEFLRALDHYFVYDDAKNKVERPARNQENTAERKTTPRTPGKIPVKMEGNRATVSAKIPLWIEGGSQNNVKMPGKITTNASRVNMKTSGKNASRRDDGKPHTDAKISGKNLSETGENSQENIKMYDESDPENNVTKTSAKQGRGKGDEHRE